MLYRLGLNVGLGVSSSSLSLSAPAAGEGRPQLGRQTSSSSKSKARGALGRVQEWIRSGGGGEEVGKEKEEGGEYTSYQLTTLFAPSSSSEEESDPITISRRYSTFLTLHSSLTSRYPLLAIPSLPRAAGGWGTKSRFEPEFVERRRRDLERWLNRVGRSPVLRGAEEGGKELQSLLTNTSTNDKSRHWNLVEEWRAWRKV
ncbi:Phox homologous domain-containing protein [Leucosporidium creatinivorum]|uniref:Phox homologous domain-containing protein n=1 Tax=Leucosporidium creatinivorum TaxID=106004 RepID=A0A1Y2FVR5_9BASI|nr:Phox homologous domain-containing protein [Leucosporidium creatinivorum]